MLSGGTRASPFSSPQQNRLSVGSGELSAVPSLGGMDSQMHRPDAMPYGSSSSPSQLSYDYDALPSTGSYSHTSRPMSAVRPGSALRRPGSARLNMVTTNTNYMRGGVGGPCSPTTRSSSGSFREVGVPWVCPRCALKLWGTWPLPT